jgi:hypothetical protein
MRFSATSILLPLLVVASQATQYYVSAANSSDTYNGSSGAPWATIAKAVGSTSPVGPGDTIIVKAGTYAAGQIDFGKSGAPGKPILLKAETGVVVNCTGENGLNLRQLHDWILDGFRLNNVPHWGIALWGARNIIIQNCYIYRCGASAIIAIVSNFGTNDIYPVPQLSNIKILHNTIERANDVSGDNEGISVWATDTFEVAYNRLIDCRREGIDCKTGSRNGSVHHNIISGQANYYSGTGMGVYIDAWHYNTFNIDIYNNLVYNSEEGVEINCEDCAKGGMVRNIRVFNNIFYNNIDPQNTGWKGRGISFYACCDAGPHRVDSVHIFNNTIVGTKIVGISLENPDASNIFIRDNIVFNNGSSNDISISKCSSALVENNIVSGAVRNSAGSAATLTGNRVADPLFVNASSRDYHLQSTSPAIDKAVGGDVASFDFDDAPRPRGDAADIGAYEFSTVSVHGRRSILHSGNSSSEFRYLTLSNEIRFPRQLIGEYSVKLFDLSGKAIATGADLRQKSPTGQGVRIVTAKRITGGTGIGK